jgi:hypothetical protein
LDGILSAAADRAGLPEFIAREFREFLTCGALASRARWRPDVVAYHRTERDRAMDPRTEGAGAPRPRTGRELC